MWYATGMDHYVVVGIAGVVAVIGTVLGHRGASGRAAPGVRVVKTAVPLLLWMVLLRGEVHGAWRVVWWALVVGMPVTAVADWLLAPVDNRRTFVMGLLAFLVGYAIYGAGMARMALIVGLQTHEVVVICGVVAIVGGAQYATLSHVQRSLRAAVALYVVVASVLLASALALGVAAGDLFPWRVTGVIIGASSIYLSDSLIAHNLFRRPLPAPELWIMPTYYIGQLSLVVAVSGAV